MSGRSRTIQYVMSVDMQYQLLKKVYRIHTIVLFQRKKEKNMHTGDNESLDVYG